MILGRNHVPYCYCGSVNKACNCICLWWYCDASIYRAVSTDRHETYSFAGWILWIWYNPMCWSSVTASRQSWDDEGQVSLSMDIIIHGIKPQYLDWGRLWSIASLKDPLSHNIADTNGFLAAGHCSQYGTWNTCVYDQCQLLVGCSSCPNALIIRWSTSFGNKIKGCLASIKPSAISKRRPVSDRALDLVPLIVCSWQLRLLASVKTCNSLRDMTLAIKRGVKQYLNEKVVLIMIIVEMSCNNDFLLWSY